MGPFREYDIEKLRNIFYGESSDAILRIPFVAHIDHFRAAKSSICLLYTSDAADE